MEFVIIYAISVILIVSFCVIEKKSHPLEFAFVWFVITFVYITLFDMATPRNSHFYELTKYSHHFWSQRLTELVIIPLIILFYLEWVQLSQKWLVRIFTTLVCIALLSGIEWLLLSLQTIDYNQWQSWWSPVISWPLFVGFALLLRQAMRKILRKEGVVR